MTRKRNQRVVMREKMMEAKGWLHTMTEAWRVNRTTYDSNPDGPLWNATRRQRRPEEYPENRIVNLEELIHFIRSIRYRLNEVEQIARQRVAELKEAERRG